VSAPARLLALRLQGFKSFAEKTVVEFGPGISAVVGPNGSGKSNLADGLRWALGEQGRALRIRKSEDVIFAGSERRAALGMADVTLVLDNADRLLPVDFATLELGRRLYRSGENDYLLNRQRIRLRDLVDLLDSAHLADNAFLFIGQGMVDQALALRPEERRPLFEEVAGVRRHERRRRRAEEQLVESEANLARVDDILAELRPQARRLAAQAEQQATRQSAGDDLAAALVLSAHARWHAAAGRVAAASADRERARAEADRAMAALTAAEQAVSAIAAELGRRVAIESERRMAHEAARAELTALQLREARLAGDSESAARDRERLGAERSAAETDVAIQRRTLALPVPARDHEAEEALADAERALADALAELGSLRAARQAQGEQLAALRRAEAARQAELETARRRAAEAGLRASEARTQAAEGAEHRTALEAESDAARDGLVGATEAETATASDREAARTAVEAAEAAHRAASELVGAATERRAALGGRIEGLEARLAEEEARGIARVARRLGGRRVGESLEVDPPFRAAVQAALGEAERAYLVGLGAVESLSGERGVLFVEERLGDGGTRGGDVERSRAVRGRAAALGGGGLVDAVRRDDIGVARRLLERVVWVPDLASALELQAELPEGWTAVTRDGAAVVTSSAVTLGRPDAALERRAELGRLIAELGQIDEALQTLEADRAASAREAEAARGRLHDVRAAEADAASRRHAAEAAERVAARALEAALRETAWQEAQLLRLEAEASRAEEALAALESDRERHDAAVDDLDPAGGDDAIVAGTWEARVAELRARRDRLAAQVGEAEGLRREAEARRARAEAAVAMGEERMARADRELAALVDREATARSQREALATELAAASEREGRTRAALAELHEADAADRGRLATAEADASTARERLRAIDERVRLTDMAELEARLALDAIRESVLVELAGLGAPGARRLAEAVEVVGPEAAPEAGSGDIRSVEARVEPDGAEPADDAEPADEAEPEDEADEAAQLERLLDVVGPLWAAETPPADPPSPGRLAGLRRRYHDLGAANPYAVEEYGELRTRLEALEGQAVDLRQAIGRTRGMIEELNELIAEQFRSTFRALEDAFDRCFQRLFGGGFARLSLTDPSDLSATGIEIVARPPGKKSQNLSMLSGGERALTAVALLFAMLEVRPVPFCVLDEVDAALDEANVGRFVEALRNLADRTQCIVITHNRGTIESADALYGVTVGDDSVSRVISLRLEEAQEIADRARRSDRLAAG
jgi:chromosome segregation protein